MLLVHAGLNLKQAHESLNAEFIASLYETPGIVAPARSPSTHQSAVARPTARHARRFSMTMSPMQRLLTPFVKRLLATDYDLGIEVLGAWRHYYNQVDTKEAEDLSSLEEYIPYRIIDFGSGPWLVMIRFAMGLDVPGEELMSIKAIEDAGLKSAALTNDYWSWPKEIAGKDASNSRLMNSVSFAIARYNLSEQQAREHIKGLAIQAEKEFIALRASWLFR